MSQARRSSIALAITLSAFAWALRAEGAESPLAFHNFEPGSPGAQRGLEHLYAGNILAVKGGIPASLIRRADRLTGEGQIAKLQDPARQWQRLGFAPSPPARGLGLLEPGKSLPLAMSAHALPGDGQGEPLRAVTTTCLSCHVGVIDGQVVAGASNGHAYFLPFADDMATVRRMRTMLRLNPIWRFGTTALEKDFLDVSIDYFDMVLRPMLQWQRTRGAITGPASVLTYLTRMTTNMAGSGLGDSLRHDLREVMRADMAAAPYQAPPVKAHPWWTIKYKSTLYRYPEAKGADATVTAQYFMDRHIGVSTALSPRHLPVVRDVLQFAAETRAPRYQRPLDAELVAEGERIFHERPIEALRGATCAGCHGTYRRVDGRLQVAFPGRYVDVGTDSAVFEAGRYYMNLVKRRVPANELPDYGDYPQTPGYLAPPLVGVWATAPYLHNGSVPTLYAVLKASARPRVWARSLDMGAYDEQDGGVVALAPEDATEAGQIYDTTVPAYGNAGHAFVDGWDDAALYAVVEFLKSLDEGL